MTVWDIEAGKSAKIKRNRGKRRRGRRLRSLGFTDGRVVTVLGYSLLKSSVLLSCGSVRLAARRSLAGKIEVEP